MSEPRDIDLTTLITMVEGEIDMVQGGADYFDSTPSREAYDKLAGYATELVRRLRTQEGERVEGYARTVIRHPDRVVVAIYPEQAHKWATAPRATLTLHPPEEPSP